MDGDQGDSGSLSDDYLNDSFASVGNSTRSLLSPILNEKLYIKTSTPGKDRQEFEDNKGQEEEEDDYTPEKSKNMVLTSISLAKRGEDISLSRTDKGSRIGSSYSSSFSSSYLESSKHKDTDEGGKLSPWENWLIKKTSENREKRKMRKIEETKKKIELEEKEREKESKRQDIEEKLRVWLQEKEETEKIKRNEEKRELKEQRESKMKKQIEIEEKSKKVFNQWLEEKKAADLEAKKKKENEEFDKKQKEVEKRMKSEEAFEKWLQNCKKGSRSNNQSSNHQQVGLQGCYDWASYPCPSYINPMPWVPPVSKHRGRISKNKELQPVSPPLLFRDYEQRTKKTSRKHTVKCTPQI